MASHWSLRDSKSPQVSTTLVSTLADLNNAVVWMISTRSRISSPPVPCTNLFGDCTERTNYDWYYRHFIIVVVVAVFERFFLPQRKLMDISWDLIDSKSPQVSRTLLSILADLSNAIVCMVLSFPSFPVPFPILWGLFKVQNPQLVSPLPSRAIVFLVVILIFGQS